MCNGPLQCENLDLTLAILDIRVNFKEFDDYGSILMRFLSIELLKSHCQCYVFYILRLVN